MMRRCRRHAGAMGVKDGLLLIIVAVLVSGGLFVVGGAVMPRAGDVSFIKCQNRSRTSRT